MGGKDGSSLNDDFLNRLMLSLRYSTCTLFEGPCPLELP